MAADHVGVPDRPLSHPAYFRVGHIVVDEEGPLPGGENSMAAFRRRIQEAQCVRSARSGRSTCEKPEALIGGLTPQAVGNSMGDSFQATTERDCP